MFDFVTQITNAATALSNDVRQADRRRKIKQQFQAAETAIAAEYKNHVSEAATIQSRQNYARALSVTWHDIINLGNPYSSTHERRLEDLKSKVLENTEEKGELLLVPDPATLEALRVPRVAAVRDRAELDLSTTLNRSLEAALQIFDTECTSIENRAAGKHRDELRALTAEKRDVLVSATQASAMRDEARVLLDAAQTGWAEQVETSYRSALQDKLADFDKNDRPILVAQVVRNRTAAFWIKKMLFEGKGVPNAKLGREYQKSDQHLQDQLINTVTLMVLEDGSLEYRARERDAGGQFSFEKNYMYPSKKFLNQANYPPPDPQVRGPEDRILPFALRFLDQVPMPVMTSESLKQGVFFDLRKGDRVGQVLRQFEGNVLEFLHDADDNRIDERPFIKDYPGTARISKWLDTDPARQISVALRPDGLLAVVVKLNDSKTTIDDSNSSEVIKLREDYNNARLMSLLTVALVSRVLNGPDTDRSFPTPCGQSNRLHISSYCIWPLQVDPQGAVTRAETLLEKLESGLLKLDKVPRWAVGWSPAVQADALAARFTYTAERHLRVLNSTGAGPIKVRKGVNEQDALHKLTQWFKYTCLLLGALWAAMVLSTVVATSSYTVPELWLCTLAFSVIGIWRCLICWGLSARAREPRPTTRGDDWLSRLGSSFSKSVGKVVELAFAYRWFLLIGPTVMCMLIATTFYWQEEKWALSHAIGFDFGAPDAKEPAGKDITVRLGEAEPEADAAGFSAALYKGVWALPLLAIGLMRHGYMLLYDLVLQRGQLQRKLNSVVGVQETLAAGQALPSLKIFSDGETPAPTVKKTLAIGDALARMKTRVTDEITAARSRFDKGSAANAALVAVIGLLAPFSAMEARTFNEDKSKRFEGMATELTKAHPNLIEKLRPLIPEYLEVNQIDVTPEVLADLGTLNEELTGLLQTLRHIQKNRDVTISARTDEAHRHLGALAAQLERLQPEPLVVGANTGPAETALEELEQSIKETQLPRLPVDVETENAIAAVKELSEAMRRATLNSKVAVDADIGAALRELGFLKAVLDQLREGTVIPMTPEGQRPPATAGWIDIDLAFINAATYPKIVTKVLPPLLEQCDLLGGMSFDTNDANVREDKWFSGRNVADKTDLDSLVARLKSWKTSQDTAADDPSRIYIVGLADAQGNAVANLNLSKRRAEAVKEALSKEIDDSSIVTLPLGEAGWLADTGLPDRESDSNHRSATVYLCPQRIQVADNSAGGDTQ